MASARSLKSLTVVPKVLAPIALAVWLGFMYLSLQYDATRPTVIQPAQGRVYTLNNHGHVVYLTAHEQDNLDHLEWLAIVLFAIAFSIGFSLRESEYVGEIPRRIRDRAYSLSTGVGWYAVARSLQSTLPSIGPSVKDGLAQAPVKVDIRSDEPFSECRDRLARDVYLNPMHVSGSFNGRSLHLYLERENFRNSFAPHFYGVLESRSGQTRLTGRFGMHWFVRIFLAVWFGFFVILELLLVSSYTGFGLHTNSRLFIFFPLAFIFCGLLMVHWSKQLATEDKTRITEFLERSMRARAEQYL